MVLAEPVISQVAEILRPAHGLGLEGLLAQVVADPDADIRRIGIELLGELPFGYVEHETVYPAALAGVYLVGYGGEPPLGLDLAADRSVVVAQIVQVRLKVLARILHEQRVEHHRRSAYLLPEAVYTLAAAV